MSERLLGFSCRLCGPDPTPCGANYCPASKVDYSVYVATGLQNIEDAKRTVGRLVELGFSISYDWTVHGSLHDKPESWSGSALAEQRGVSVCDALLVLLPGGRGTHVELGVALGGHRKILLVGTDEADRERACIFYHHPRVSRAAELSTAIHTLRAWREEKGRNACASYSA